MIAKEECVQEFTMESVDWTNKQYKSAYDLTFMVHVLYMLILAFFCVLYCASINISAFMVVVYIYILILAYMVMVIVV